MRHGPLVFLAAFVALAASWSGLVLAPQIQLGGMQPQTNAVNKIEQYPQMRPGLARQGLQVYRAAGCAACHSQQIRQTGVQCDVVITDPGTNAVAVAEAMLQSSLITTNLTAGELASKLPRHVLRGAAPESAKFALNAIQAAGAKATIQIVPIGPDIARGWGVRRTVAADYLFDDPVMPGSQRVGPDLANVGLRLPDPKWHLLHLYHPRLTVENSLMPPYPFLFEQRRIGPRVSPDALLLPEPFAPPDGFEIVPRPEARELVAYLLSLRADVPLFEAPLTPADAGNTAAQTNNPAQ